MVSAKGLISHLIIGGLVEPFIHRMLSIKYVLGFLLGTKNTVVNKKQVALCAVMGPVQCTHWKSKEQRP